MRKAYDDKPSGKLERYFAALVRSGTSNDCAFQDILIAIVRWKVLGNVDCCCLGRGNKPHATPQSEKLGTFLSDGRLDDMIAAEPQCDSH